MKVLDKLILRIGNDKLLHFLVAYAMTATGAMFSFVAGFVTAVAVVLLSVVKELWLDDLADWKDVLYAVIGCVCCLLAGVVTCLT